MYGDCSIRVEVLENGFTVAYRDPAIDEENKKPKSKWEDPWKEYGFSTAEEASKFVSEKLKELHPPPDGEQEFAAAFNDASDDED